MHQNATWYGCRPQPRGFCVRSRPSPSSPKRGRPPNFRPMFICVRWGPSPLPTKGVEPLPNFRPISITAKRLDASRCHLIMDVGLSPGDFVLDGDPFPSPQKVAAPKFSANVYCGQTAGWIKMPLGTKVGPGDSVLDGDPAPPSQKGGIARGRSPNFRPMPIVAKRLDASKCHLVWM